MRRPLAAGARRCGETDFVPETPARGAPGGVAISARAIAWVSVLLLSTRALASMPIGPCDPVEFEIQGDDTRRISADGVHLQAAVDEQANTAGTADLPQPGEWWTANSEDGGATANSSFSVHQYGATLVAVLSQQINCNAGQQATAAGTAYLQVRVTNVPGGGQIAHLRVNTYRTVRPSTSLNGEVKFNGTGVPLTEDYVSSSSEVYEIDLANGGWIPVTRLGI